MARPGVDGVPLEFGIEEINNALLLPSYLQKCLVEKLRVETTSRKRASITLFNTITQSRQDFRNAWSP